MTNKTEKDAQSHYDQENPELARQYNLLLMTLAKEGQ